MLDHGDNNIEKAIIMPSPFFGAAVQIIWRTPNPD